MSEDYASMKQIQFMKTLGFPPQPTTLTKAQARMMIDEKLKERAEEIEPEHKHPPAQAVPTPGPGTKNGTKECHLSPESVKLGALECAIAYKGQVTGILETADKFVEWIYK